MDAFVVSFGVVLLAELGDKSQLIALAFAARYPALKVLLAVTVAALIAFAGWVVLGRAVAAVLPTEVISIAAGLAFFGFAAWTLRGEESGDGEGSAAERGGRWVIVAITTTFLLAELGDKTMLVALTLAATQEPIGTWLGSAAGMVAADTIAIAIGSFVGDRLPGNVIRVGSAVVFVVFGALMVAEGLGAW
jgi:putative Ca2+/H+ antiporter (TMEM165/GDT1 family)